MPQYLTNLSKETTLLLKEGALEIRSGQSIAIGKTDVASGIFEDVVNKGLAKIVTADTLPAPLYPVESMPYQKHWDTAGMSTDEASAYLASQKPGTQAVAGKVTSFGRK